MMFISMCILLEKRLGVKELESTVAEVGLNNELIG
jgi:hypothetical protein